MSERRITSVSETKDIQMSISCNEDGETSIIINDRKFSMYQVKVLHEWLGNIIREEET